MHKIYEWFKKLGPYEGIFRFMVMLLAVHFFWKYTVIGEEEGVELHWMGLNIAPPFLYWSQVLTNLCASTLDLLGVQTKIINTTILFTNQHALRVVWGCNGFKQSFIFFTIILASRGPWKMRSLYAVFCVLCAQIINYLRILFLCYIVYQHREYFDLFHSYITKYLFYFLFFLLWVYWDERLVPYFALKKEGYSTKEAKTKLKQVRQERRRVKESTLKDSTLDKK